MRHLIETAPAGADRRQVAATLRALTLLDGRSFVKADGDRLRRIVESGSQTGLNLPLAPTAAQPDVTAASALVAAFRTAKRDGAAIIDTLDASKVPERGFALFRGQPIYDAYGPRGSAMTYRATLDPAGRLATLALDVPGTLAHQASAAPQDIPSDAPTDTPGYPITITITGYGTAPVPARPVRAVALPVPSYDLIANDND